MNELIQKYLHLLIFDLFELIQKSLNYGIVIQKNSKKIKNNSKKHHPPCLHDYLRIQKKTKKHHLF